MLCAVFLRLSTPAPEDFIFNSPPVIFEAQLNADSKAAYSFRTLPDNERHGTLAR